MKTSSAEKGPNSSKYDISVALKNSRRAIWGVGFISIIVNLLMLTGPLYMLQIYDRVLSSRSTATLLALTVLMIGLYAFMWVFEHIRTRIAARIGSELDEDLSRATFSLWLKQGLYGESSKRVQPLNDLGQIRNFFAGGGPIAIFDLPWIPLYIFVIFLLHWILGIFAVIGTLIIIIAAIANELRTRKPLEDATRKKVQSQDFAARAHRNADAIKAMGMRQSVQERWAKTNAESSQLNLKSTDRSGGYSAFSKSFRMMVQSGILGLGGALALMEVVTPGAMIAASIILGRALSPVQSALGQWRNITLSRQAYRRLKEFFEAVPLDDNRLPLPSPEGRISVEQAFAAPPGSGTPTIMGINFSIEPGQGLGVIGSVASGKSTLAKLLVGIWLPYNGKVRLDDATYNQWNQDMLGPYIGYLPQAAELLDGTIGENISRFYPNPNPKDIIKAAKRAGIHEVILEFEEGYETYLGEGGTVLSGGQVQRIALARALFGDPSLVVMDEPNANLDSQGDAALTSAIMDLRRRGKTVIVMTHRPSALKALDMVLMLHKGQQVAFGKKDEVLSKMHPQKLGKSKPAFQIGQPENKKSLTFVAEQG